MATQPIPAGYHSVTPYLIVNDGNAAIAFYVKAFGATERMRMEGPGGRIGHAEIEIGDSCVMLADEHPEMGFRSPKTIGGSPVSLAVYTENVDQMFQTAIAAGAKCLRDVQDQFYGDRSGTLEDPFGHVWTLSTHIEDVSEEEMKKRMAAMAQKPDAA